MPKRNTEEQIEFYKNKIKHLQSEEFRRRRRIIVNTDSSDVEKNSDIETNDNENNLNIANDSSTQLNENPVRDVHNSAQTVEVIPVPEQALPALDPEGEKDQIEKIFKDYAIPQNCKLFRAPLLNPEIAAVVPEFVRARDKKIESSQQQLGVGLTALNRAMTLLITSDNKVQAMKCMSDACRILSNIHVSETHTRIESDKSALGEASPSRERSGSGGVQCTKHAACRHIQSRH